MRVTRLSLVAPWAASALALALSAPSLDAAPRHGKSAAHCVHYRQKMDHEESGVDFTLSNRCSFDVSCTLRWEVHCDGQDGAQAEGAAFDLAVDQSDSAHASAAACEGDWEVRKVTWSCDPVRPAAGAEAAP